MDRVLGLIGCIGGLLCAIADVMFDLKGPGNEKLGRYALVDCNWLRMAAWRFPASISLAAIGVPMYFMGFVAMYHLLLPANTVFARCFMASATIGALGGLFIHATTCYGAILLRKMEKHGQRALAVELIDELFGAIKIPFAAMFTLLVIVPSGMLIHAIATGMAPIPKAFLALNPLVLMLLGVTLRKLNPHAFTDLPGIAMPSVGIAMIGLAAYIGM